MTSDDFSVKSARTHHNHLRGGDCRLDGRQSAWHCAPTDVAVLIHTYDAIHAVFPYILSSIAFNLPKETHGSTWRLYFANEERPLEETLLASLPVPVTQLRTGPRPSRKYSYVSSLSAALKLFPEELVMYLQEDFFLDAPLTQAELSAIITLTWRASSGVTYLWAETQGRCFHGKHPSALTEGPVALTRSSMSPVHYQYTHHGGLWRRSYLEATLKVPSDGSAGNQEEAFRKQASFLSNVDVPGLEGARGMIGKVHFCAQSFVNQSALRTWHAYMHYGLVVESHRAQFAAMCRSLNLSIPPDFVFFKDALHSR